MEREKLIATVTAAQNGDSDALNELFNAFYNDVYYFALKTIKDDDLACDITQETFVEIINTIGDLHEPAAFVKWMKQITYHQCTRYFKKKKDVLVDEDEEGNTIFDTLAEDKTEFIPDEALDQQDFRDTILAMLDELSEEQRSATMLYYYDELSVKQIAEIQNVSEGTVKSRLNYARKSIKNSVETYEKKNGVKLHCAGVLPLLLWLLSQTGKETMPAAAANAVAGGVTAATGVTVSAAASAGGAAATATTVAATSGVGIAAKIAALPVITKVIAGVVTGALVLGGIGMAIWPGKETASTENATQATKVPMDTGSTDEHTGFTGEVIPAGCKYIMGGGTELQAGEYMPKVPGKNDEFITADYKYTFSGAGWESSVLDKSKTEYEPLLATINGYPLKAVHFADCQHMISAPILPDTVTGLDSAFYGCSSMTTAPVIPQGVKNLSLTFAHCVSLEAAPVIPDGARDLFATFTDCVSLEIAPELPAGVTDLAMTFQGCSSLKIAPTIPQGVTDLSSTFADCTSLEIAPEIPNGVTDMSATFSGCRSLTNAPVIPESVTDMTLTFSGCSSLAGTVEINAKLPLCVLCEGDCVICSEGILCWNCYSCTAYGSCFYGTQGITLKGACPELYDIALHAGGSNITVDSPCAMPLPGVYGTIPVGCNYVSKSGITYTAGQAFPNKPSNGDQFITPDYTYCFGNSAVKRPDGSYTFITWNSWCVFVNDTTKTSYSGIYESVNGYYVTGMLGTFAGCTNLIVPPAIPTHVTNISGAFEGCTSMTTAPMIPRRVEDMEDAFRRCVALTGTITVHADDIEYSSETFSCNNCFYGTAQSITLTGSSTKLAELAATSNNGNVTVQRSE